MVEARTVIACVRCEVFWDEGEAAKCDNHEHPHQKVDLHRHRSRVVFPDGSVIVAVSFDASDPYSRDTAPDYGLYLDRRWRPPWPYDHIDWPDFGLPADRDVLLRSLETLHKRARRGEHVELGCLGGHGRTGTALACLAVLSGRAPAEAVAWVRANYCSKAVDTGEQEAFVAALTPDPS